MARWRRPGADEILLVFLLLDVIGFICGGLSHGASPRNLPLPSFLTDAFLVWRVSRGGRISRIILIIGSGAVYAATALAVARLWDAAGVAFTLAGMAIIAFQPRV